MQYLLCLPHRTATPVYSFLSLRTRSRPCRRPGCHRLIRPTKPWQRSLRLERSSAVEAGGRVVRQNTLSSLLGGLSESTSYHSSMQFSFCYTRCLCPSDRVKDSVGKLPRFRPQSANVHHTSQNVIDSQTCLTHAEQKHPHLFV